MGTLQIETMSREQIDFAVDLAAAEGWNPGLDDAECFYRSDPEGFLLGRLDRRPIGCISATSYQGLFGFIGFYIVIPELRGKGYGIQLWRAAMKRLEGHNIGLDGVVDQQANYAKSGFQLAYRNIRYEGTKHESARDQHSIPIHARHLDQVEAIDRRLFPARRTAFLKAWLAYPGASARGTFDGDAMTAFGVIRPCRQGYKIGPLYAEDDPTAEQLIDDLIADIPVDKPYYLDTPETNAAAVDLAERRGMRKVFETARMYTQDKPNIAVEKIYGVTTFELG